MSYITWNLKDEFTITEAAYILCGIEPPVELDRYNELYHSLYEFLPARKRKDFEVMYKLLQKVFNPRGRLTHVPTISKSEFRDFATKLKIKLPENEQIVPEHQSCDYRIKDASLGIINTTTNNNTPNKEEVIKSIPAEFEAMKKNEFFDIFIGHASEDKEHVARPIYEECKKRGLKAFIDEIHIGWGDSLTEKINNALGKSKYFLAILSDKSITKSWLKKELHSAIAKEISGGQKVLPLIVGDADKILKEIPLLNDKLHIKWDGDASHVVNSILGLNG